MRKLLIVLTAAMIMISLMGCSNLLNNENGEGNNKVGTTPQSSDNTSVKEQTLKLKLYFPTIDNDNVFAEEREVLIKNNEVMKAAMEALIGGPESGSLRNPMPEGTKLLGIDREDNVAVVEFSKEYSNTEDIAELVQWVSVVNTLTEIDGVEKVRILVEGEDLVGPSGQPYGELSRVEFDESLISQSVKGQKVTLYFSDSEAEFVVPESREVEVVSGKSTEEVIINELIKGPQTGGLSSVIPEGTRLISVETKDGVCTLNLSKEFIGNNYIGSAGETMIIYSIVNSLTELQDVRRVQFLIEGKKREVYLHMAFDTPIERDDKIIKKQ